ncbi:MAG: substrate-binding domain-containing protein [Limisphaerales bacterium]
MYSAIQKNRGKSAKPFRVALLVETSRTYGRQILAGVARYAHVCGSWTLFTQERELHSGIPNWLRTWKGDGIIARIEDKRTANSLLQLGFPVVDVLGNAWFKKIPGFDTDARAVARMAADFFLKAGFRHFAFCGYRGVPFSDRRAATFADYLATQGQKVRVFSPSKSTFRFLPRIQIQAIEQRGIEMEQAIAAWLRRQPRPLAFFACNDVCGQQVLNACREHGIKVPEEIAVMGVDNDDVLCNLCEPPLSSIEPAAERIGYDAAVLLDRMMKGHPAKAVVTQIPPLRVVERISTDAVAIEDPITVQAVHFIRDHVSEGIAVKDVLTCVNRSRTDMEQRFRHWLKCSIHAEILRLRMDRVCGLLRQTDLNLNEIAARAGFATAAHLCRLFRRHFGKTPTRYRNRLLK